MLHFSSTPPDDPRGYALPLVRTPAGKAIVAVVYSDDLVGCATHFWGGRTVPCDGDQCTPCGEGVSWRWHAWVAAFSPASHHCFLFESTARVASIFVAYRQQHGTLRGCKFRAQRRTPARNSRVYLECVPADLQVVHLPDPPDLVKCLHVLWNVPLQEINIEGIARGTPRIVTTPKGNGDQVTPDGQILTSDHESRRKNPPHARDPRNG